MEFKSTKDIIPFVQLEADIASYKIANSNLVFNYEDPAGNKEARSHIAKLRKVKTLIASTHTAEKADILKAGRAIDAKKNKQTGIVEEMIAVHLDPIKAIEEREQKELEAKQEAEQQEQERAEAEKIEADRLKEEDFARREADIQKQLAEIKQAQADREAEQKAKEAAEVARREALEQAEKDKAAALENAEREKQAAIEAERELARKEAEAKEQAELARIEAEEAEKERLARLEQIRKDAIANRREINNITLSVFVDYGMDEDKAKALILDIAKEIFPTLTINY